MDGVGYVFVSHQEIGYYLIKEDQLHKYVDCACFVVCWIVN